MYEKIQPKASIQSFEALDLKTVIIYIDHSSDPYANRLSARD
jgi:hypothetical protein